MIFRFTTATNTKGRLSFPSPFGDIMFWVHICANSGYLVEAGQYISWDTLDSSSYKTDSHDTKHIILFLLLLVASIVMKEKR